MRFVPSAVVAVMVAVPLPTAVTTPSLLTVATPVSLLVHVTLVLLALDGVTVAVSVDVWPAAAKLRLLLLSEMPVAGMLNDTAKDTSVHELVLDETSVIRIFESVPFPEVDAVSSAVTEIEISSPLDPVMTSASIE